MKAILPDKEKKAITSEAFHNKKQEKGLNNLK